MDSGDVQLAALVGALGATLLLFARGRLTTVGGLTLLAGAELALLQYLSDQRISPKVAALGLAALLALTIGAGILVRWPFLVTLVIVAAAPFRPPLSFGSENRFYIGVASAGQLGRLAPLYGVLGAAALALAWQALRGREVRPLPWIVALPATAFLCLTAVSLFWTDDLPAGANVLAYFLLPFATLVGVVARAPFPAWMPGVLAVIGVAVAALFAGAGLIQAATRELWFFSPAVEVSNAYKSFFRVTSLFRDPSLYGRHVVLGIAVVLVLVLLRRLSPLLATPIVAFLFAGLWFSYSQSSMAALFAVTIALAAFAGDRSLRTVAAITAALVVLAGGAVFAASASEHSARSVTSDRSRLIELSAKVIRDHPVAGVGIGAQPAASQARSKQGGSRARFVSHTTPLTVAAELGLFGLAAYLGLLAGACVLIRRVYRDDRALGLGLAAVLLALFVHSLFYSGFFEDPITWVVLGVASSFVLAKNAAAQ